MLNYSMIHLAHWQIHWMCSMLSLEFTVTNLYFRNPAKEGIIVRTEKQGLTNIAQENYGLFHLGDKVCLTCVHWDYSYMVFSRPKAKAVR